MADHSGDLWYSDRTMGGTGFIKLNPGGPFPDGLSVPRYISIIDSAIYFFPTMERMVINFGQFKG